MYIRLKEIKYAVNRGEEIWTSSNKTNVDTICLFRLRKFIYINHESVILTAQKFRQSELEVKLVSIFTVKRKRNVVSHGHER